MRRLLIIGLVVLSLVFVGCGNEEMITGGAVAIDGVIGGCKDSDGGVEPDVKGVVSTGGDDFDDTCISGLLVEYYCDGDNLANQNIRCSNECSNGKCA